MSINADKAATDRMTTIYGLSSSTAQAIVDSVNRHLKDQGLMEIKPVVYALIAQESKFNPALRGGLLQLTPAALNAVDECKGIPRPGDLTNIDANVRAAINYLHLLASDDAASANGGLGAVIKKYNGGGDRNYFAHVLQWLPNYTDDTALIGKLRNGRVVPVQVQGSVRAWLQATYTNDSPQSLRLSTTGLKRGETLTVSWSGRNSSAVVIPPLIVRFRHGRGADDYEDKTVGPIGPGGVATVKFNLTPGAETKTGTSSILVTARTVSDKCGGSAKSLKAEFKVSSRFKVIVITRADGIAEHYRVSDGNPKYAQLFNVPESDVIA
jgi:hypothetical protein